MTQTRKLTGLGAAVAVAAVLFAALAASASAQLALPYKAFGTGVDAGATVEVFVDGQLAGTAAADAQGQWVVDVEGQPGQTISFAVNGVPQNETAEFVSGGSSPVPDGQSLTAAEEEEPEPEAPPPADTGNAGLLGGSAGASIALVMLLGIAAATLVAGARTATRRA